MSSSPHDKTSDLLSDFLQKIRKDARLRMEVTDDPDGASKNLGGRPLSKGERLGRYVLGYPIASGGMGQVWHAHDSELRRSVALKVVLPERVNEKSLQMFLREARAGGRLSHPNVVQTYDFGRDEGCSWIAQELVQGSWTLKDFLSDVAAHGDVSSSYYRALAELVAQIAEGLEAVHQAGVSHRDLKPANILIAENDVPKITDFGLARISEDSFVSEEGDFAGTWAYMSPEQVTAKRIGLDHRTDIFSLGVVMYELLARRRPFDGDTTAQLAEKIIYEDPQPVRAIRSRCPRELEVICFKAMAKRPASRYQRAGDLAQDLRRFIRDEPIHATPPTTIERATKWVRRNPTKSVALGLTAVTVACVTYFAVENSSLAKAEAEQARAAIASAREAERQRMNADEALARAEALLVERDSALSSERERARELEAISQFQQEQLSSIEPALMGAALREDLIQELSSLDESGSITSEAEDPRTSVNLSDLSRVDFTGIASRSLHQTIYQSTLNALERSFKDQPLLVARLQNSVGTGLADLGMAREATKAFEAAVEARSRILGEEHRHTLDSRGNLAHARALNNDVVGAVPILREVLEAQRTHLGPEDEITLRTAGYLASALIGIGQYEESEQLLRSAYEIQASRQGAEHPDSLKLARELAEVLDRQGQHEEANQLLTGAVQVYRSREVDDASLKALGSLASNLKRLGKFERVTSLYREAYDGAVSLRGRDHPSTLATQSNLAGALRYEGRIDEAVEMCRDNVQRFKRTLGSDHSMTLTAENNLADLLITIKSYEEAEGILRKVIQKQRLAYGPDSPETLVATANLGNCLRRLGKYEAAANTLESAIQISVEHNGDEHYVTLQLLHNLAGTLRAMDHPDAERRSIEVIEARREVLGERHPSTLISEGNLALFYYNKGRLQEAERLSRRTLEGRRETFGDGHRETVGAISILHKTLMDAGRPEEAEIVLIQSLTLVDEPEDHPAVKRIAGELVEAHGLSAGSGETGTVNAILEDWLGKTSLGPEDPVFQAVEAHLKD